MQNCITLIRFDHACLKLRCAIPLFLLLLAICYIAVAESALDVGPWVMTDHGGRGTLVKPLPATAWWSKVERLSQICRSAAIAVLPLPWQEENLLRREQKASGHFVPLTREEAMRRSGLTMQHVSPRLSLLYTFEELHAPQAQYK